MEKRVPVEFQSGVHIRQKKVLRHQIGWVRHSKSCNFNLAHAQKWYTDRSFFWFPFSLNAEGLPDSSSVTRTHIYTKRYIHPRLPDCQAYTRNINHKVGLLLRIAVLIIVHQLEASVISFNIYLLIQPSWYNDNKKRYKV